MFARKIRLGKNLCYQNVGSIRGYIHTHVVTINLVKSNKRLIEVVRGREERLPPSSMRALCCRDTIISELTQFAAYCLRGA